jgi:uncharacterized YccA/Bax inhibitor family protein
MANPAFTHSPAFSDEAAPFATSSAEVMTYDDTIRKIMLAFAVLVAGAALGWQVPVLAIPAAIAGFVLALVNIFRKTPSPGLILTYAALEGVFVGGISQFYEGQWDGIVTQALLGTLGVVGATLLLFLNGKVRSSPKMTRFFLVAMVGYAAFSLVNFGLQMFGVTESMFGLRDVIFLGLPLGVYLGVFVVFMAAYSLVLDFEEVKHGVERRAPRIFAWQAAFGLVMTVVWLYLEILRLIALLRGSN